MEELLHFEIFSVGNYSLKIDTLLAIAIIFLVTKLLLWITKKVLFRRELFKRYNEGTPHAIFQITRYLIWSIAITLTLESIGVKVTVLVAGSAALLVGIGLGLQQTFNDVISGIILLIEGSTRVGDVLEVDGEVIKLEYIGLRTSKGFRRDDIALIIPNSLITTNKVINWSHQVQKTRFSIEVSVAYGSDVEKVIRLLEKSAHEHPSASASQHQSIEARLVDFGNSSLNFQLLFYSYDIFFIERIKSEIRITINRKFQENGIVIPFPQMDVYLKSKDPPSD